MIAANRDCRNYYWSDAQEQAVGGWMLRMCDESGNAVAGMCRVTDG